MPRIRVLMGKAGLDGHDRGVKVVCRALRDAGMEVIYTGLHRTREDIVETAIQEYVNLIGISVLSGAHMHIFPRVGRAATAASGGHRRLRRRGDRRRGRCPAESAGRAEIFGQDSSLQAIVDWVRAHVPMQSEAV